MIHNVRYGICNMCFFVLIRIRINRNNKWLKIASMLRHVYVVAVLDSVDSTAKNSKCI